MPGEVGPSAQHLNDDEIYLKVPDSKSVPIILQKSQIKLSEYNGHRSPVALLTWFRRSNLETRPLAHERCWDSQRLLVSLSCSMCGRDRWRERWIHSCRTWMPQSLSVSSLLGTNIIAFTKLPRSAWRLTAHCQPSDILWAGWTLSFKICYILYPPTGRKRGKQCLVENEMSCTFVRCLADWVLCVLWISCDPAVAVSARRSAFRHFVKFSQCSLFLTK